MKTFLVRTVTQSQSICNLRLILIYLDVYKLRARKVENRRGFVCKNGRGLRPNYNVPPPNLSTPASTSYWDGPVRTVYGVF